MVGFVVIEKRADRQSGSQTCSVSEITFAGVGALLSDIGACGKDVDAGAAKPVAMAVAAVAASAVDIWCGGACKNSCCGATATGSTALSAEFAATFCTADVSICTEGSVTVAVSIGDEVVWSSRGPSAVAIPELRSVAAAATCAGSFIFADEVDCGCDGGPRAFSITCGTANVAEGMGLATVLGKHNSGLVIEAGRMWCSGIGM